jgi:hypothetical protein
MLTLSPAADRGHTDIGWLDSHHTFSFGEWYDPAHMGFRALRSRECRLRSWRCVNAEYSWKEVADFISRKGCRISAAALKTRLSRKGLTPKTAKPNAGSVARSAEEGGDRKAAPLIRPGDSVGEQGVGSRGAPPVPKLAPGTFAFREDSKDL